ncbi:MAG TPA: TIGR00730 family Rossman fold protein [Bacteroidota bacterium]|nr:TIGR00730 family Rossman fold protein [Bacteroidota bacterium]
MSDQPIKAYKDLDFLNSPDARIIRMLAEYLEPQRRLRRQHIQDTIVFFGSARLRSLEEAQREKDDVLEAIRQSGKKKTPSHLLEQLQRAESLVSTSRYYEDAVELARLCTEWSLTLEKQRFVICSGGGPGIMEAANRGAHLAGGKSIGLNISLPFEQFANHYIPPELNFEFHYFFMRKFWFVYPAKALVVFPGGFGTMDEMMEILTLVQTRKLRKDVFIVLYGGEFWNKVINFQELVRFGVISPEDLDLFKTCNTPKEAFNYLRKNLTERYLTK